MLKSDFWTYSNIIINTLQNVSTKSVSNSVLSDLAITYFFETAPIEVCGLALPFSWAGLAVGAGFTIITEIGAFVAHKSLHTNHQHCSHSHSSKELTPLINEDTHTHAKKLSYGEKFALVLDYIAHANETSAATLLIMQTLDPEASNPTKLIFGLSGFGAGFFKGYAEYRTCKNTMKDSIEDNHSHDEKFSSKNSL